MNLFFIGIILGVLVVISCFALIYYCIVGVHEGEDYRDTDDDINEFQ